MSVIERAKTLWRLFRNGGLTRVDKAILVVLALYLLSPIDLIPDVVPVAGFLDDLLLLLLGLAKVTQGKTGKPPPENGGSGPENAKEVDAKIL